MNKFFKELLNTSSPLHNFIVKYEKALDARYNKKQEKAFETLDSMPIFGTLYPIEEAGS